MPRVPHCGHQRVRTDARESTVDVASMASQRGDSVDNCRFDNLTRVIAEQADRRTAVKRFAGGLAALAALARAELGSAQDVTIQSGCTLNGDNCRRARECCSKNCRNKECQCAGFGNDCRADAGCCKGSCNNGTCKCISNGSSKSCNVSGDCCSKNCDGGTCRCIARANSCSTSSQCCSGLTCKTVPNHTGTVCA
jgi:hypothetical protein